MSRSKHSKGPWIQQKRGEAANPYIVAVTADPIYYGNPPCFVVARGTPTGGQGWPAIGAGGISHAEAKANAVLIASAPELLAACEAFVVAWDKSRQLEKTDAALTLARAAIAKAKGATP